MFSQQLTSLTHIPQRVLVYVFGDIKVYPLVLRPSSGCLKLRLKSFPPDITWAMSGEREGRGRWAWLVFFFINLFIFF